jgi:phage anti-repressor protein
MAEIPLSDKFHYGPVENLVFDADELFKNAEIAESFNKTIRDYIEEQNTDENYDYWTKYHASIAPLMHQVVGYETF